MNTADLLTAYSRAQQRIFRLETLQEYRGSGEDDALGAFRAGRPPVPSQGKAEYVAMVRDAVRRGCSVQRVHIVQEPLSVYCQWELTHSYVPNAQAGERIGIIPFAGTRWPASLPRRDFWLLDDTMFWLLYSDDGRWLGVEHVSDPTRVALAHHWRDRALAQSVPWSAYVHSRPELAQHLEVTQRAS